MKKLVRSVENRAPVPLNVSDFAVPFYLSPNQKAELFISEISESNPDEDDVSKKPESSWFDLGEFPPISEQCEWKGLNGGFWVQCEVIDKYQDKEMVVFNTGEYRNCRYEILKLDSVEFRPIRTEREKFIEQAWDRLRGDTAHKETTELLGQLYDLGYRLPVAE